MKQRRAKDGDGAPTNGELDWMRTTRQYRRTLYADAAAMHLACSCPDATAMASRGRLTEDAVVVVAFVKSYSILFQMRCRFWCLGPQLREVPKRPGNCLLYIVKEMYLSLRRALPWQLPPQPRTFAQDKPHLQMARVPLNLIVRRSFHPHVIALSPLWLLLVLLLIHNN